MRKYGISCVAAYVFLSFTLVVSAEKIPWYEAPKYYGKWVTVQGQVTSAENKGNVVVLNFGPSRKGHLVVLIFKPSLHRFPERPEGYYLGKEILVTGKVQKYKGTHSITIPNPSRIEFVEQEKQPEKKRY